MNPQPPCAIPCTYGTDTDLKDKFREGKSFDSFYLLITPDQKIIFLGFDEFLFNLLVSETDFSTSTV